VTSVGISWLVSVSLAAVGSLAAYGLGLLPHAVEGPGHIEAGPEPTAHIRLAAGLATAIVLIGLVSRTWNAIRRRPVSGRRRRRLRSQLVLDGLPGATPAGHGRWQGWGRAFGVCCFAGKLAALPDPALVSHDRAGWTLR
jgi:hypothetical protein